MMICIFVLVEDEELSKVLKSLDTNLFYLSATMIERNSGHIALDCGENCSNFNEDKLLSQYSRINFFDHQGSHWAPHLIHRKIWNKIGGFSEEFNPGGWI